MSNTHRPIVIVTGSNGGVGYGICQRLFVQLCDESPLDSRPQQFSDVPQQDGAPIPLASFYPGLTLIMACRSMKRAEKARAQLLAFCDKHVQQARLKPGYTGRAEELRSNLVVDVEYLDLASMKTIFEFGGRIKAKYPYVSHLAANAGIISIDRIDYIGATKHIFTSPTTFVTKPSFYYQNQGELSIDGLGYVWQCNVFGHFALFRELESHLALSPLGARVIWCSSIEATPEWYDPQDWQLRNNKFSYQGSKFQIDLIAATLDHRALTALKNGEQRPVVRHLISQPGVVSTNVATSVTGPVIEFLKLIVFYLSRWWGIPHLPIQPYKAAIATVHLALIPFVYLSYLTQINAPPVRFGAETDIWGTEYVGLTPVRAWQKYKDGASALVDQCDQLVEKLKKEESRPLDFETASEKM